MSSKGSILLSAHNEHWYHDFMDDSITLEIDDEHKIEKDAECSIITIEKGTALHDAILEAFYRGKSAKFVIMK
ncbi:hypothetical protein ES705_38395 [subsurface metagenome]